MTAAAGALAAALAVCCLPETRTARGAAPDPESAAAELSGEDRALLQDAKQAAEGTEVSPAAVHSPQANSITSSSSGEGISAAQGGRSRHSWLRLLRNRDFLAVCVVNASIFTTVNATRSMLLPLIARESLHLSNSSVGFMFSLMAGISFALVMPASAAADRFGRKWTIVPSGLIEGAALLLIALTSSVVIFWVGVSFYAVGNAVMGAAPSAYAIDVLPPDAIGLGIGILRSAGDLGTLLGSALLGVVADASSNHTALAFSAVAVLATAAFFAVAARETVRQRPNDCGIQLSDLGSR